MKFIIADVNGAEYTINTNDWETQPENLLDVAGTINENHVVFCEKGHIVFAKHVVSVREAMTPAPKNNSVTHVHFDGSMFESVVTDKFIKAMARY